MINTHSRHQKHFKLHHFAPPNGDLCSCGCGVKLTGRRTRWATKQCAADTYFKYTIIQGNVTNIRKELYKTEKGFCRACGVCDNNWEADHIIPVHKGGGGCGIENFQTLCKECHKGKTKKDIKT